MLLPRCSVARDHGRRRDVMGGLAAGVPLVLVPTSWDKPDIALRMVEAGVAVRLAPKNCTPAGLRAAVERFSGTSATAAAPARWRSGSRPRRAPTAPRR